MKSANIDGTSPVLLYTGGPVLSPGRASSPHALGSYWLDKRPDGRSPHWQIAWYDKKDRTTRYKSARTGDVEEARKRLALYVKTAPSLPFDAPEVRRQSPLVYFIGAECGTGGIKIGIAFDIPKRLFTLQSCSPVPLRLLAATTGGRQAEHNYHARFAAHRLHGEWFARHPDILAEIARLPPPANRTHDGD